MSKRTKFYINTSLILLICIFGSCFLLSPRKQLPAPASVEVVAQITPATVLPQPTDTPPAPTATSTQPAPTPTPTLGPPTATPTSIPATPTPSFVNENEDGYLSGGLGLSKSDWERKHSVTGLDFGTMGTGYDHKYDVMFQVGNVWYIESQWSANNAVTVDVIKAEVQNLIPADNKFIKTYSPEGRSETIVNLYYSESLKNRFNQWVGGDPGNFIVMYNKWDYGITRMIIAIGNNP